MVRITERKRLGQRLQMIICLRDGRKNANIGGQFSHLTRTKTFKNDEIVISPIRKTPRPSRPLSNIIILVQLFYHEIQFYFYNAYGRLERLKET